MVHRRLFLVSIGIIILLGCGAERNLQRDDKALDPAITIEEGTGGSFSVGNREHAEALGPVNVKLTATLERLDPGYKLRLIWTYEKQRPNMWYVNGFAATLDPEGRPDFDQIENDGFQADGELVFVSRPLMAGRTYWYDIEAYYDSPNLRGTMNLKTINIDLTQAR